MDNYYVSIKNKTKKQMSSDCCEVTVDGESKGNHEQKL
jgi:hypothetical protein